MRWQRASLRGFSHAGKTIAGVLPLVKSGVVAVVANRYVHLAVITVGMTLASLMLVGVSLDLALNQAPHQIARPFTPPH